MTLIASHIAHFLTARHTLGYSVHSPFLYDIAHTVLPDKCAYYCFSPIENMRRQLLASPASVHVQDFGTGVSRTRYINEVTRTCLMPAHEAQILFKLAHFIRARHIVELGTSLGITTAYLASLSPDVSVTTYEGSPQLLQLAQQQWSKLHLTNIHAVQGNIDDTLHPEAPVDMAILDANHTKEATLRYFSLLSQASHPDTLIVIHDIRHSQDMLDAWHTICADQRVTATMDLGTMGLVFFKPYLEKKTYRIRI